LLEPSSLIRAGQLRRGHSSLPRKGGWVATSEVEEARISREQID
jgi:hypothetical protein